MESKSVIIIIGVIFSIICKTYCLNCDRTPDDVIKPKNINDINSYIISIQGNPKTYTPYQKYNVSLKINPYSLRQKAFRRFILTAEPLLEKSLTPAGKFDNDYGSEVLTTFSDNCPDTVIENSALPKSEIQVYWIAPPENSGCVAIRATVIETRENWFSEDGELTKILCEETAEDENVQPQRQLHCCACPEAKYEVAFEGKWTRNTHPRNYPQDIWSTRFSNIIGASHKRRGSFWQEGDFASDGLKELASTGSTKALESELKEGSENIRTIIQARGLQHPNITQSTYAVFRVDKKNHRVSLVSKIIPSPDWIVGVSEFELCKSDCTWLESYTYNLYPIDVGIDDGIGYMSSQPLFRAKHIMPITQNNPNDPQSPFYSEDGEKMNPIAKLHFTRQRLYDKPCSGIDISAEDTCATTDWSPWLPCSSKCGRGKTVRVRQYVNPANNESCNEVLFQEMTCWGESQGCDNSHEQSKEIFTEPETEEQEKSSVSLPPEDSRCATGSWSRWSSCSVSCGKGTRTRDRPLLNPDYEDACKGVELQQNEDCDGTEKDCDDAQTESNCPNTNWGEWSNCNVTRCGEVGSKIRLRLPVNNESYEKGSDPDDENEQVCSNQEVVECYGSCDQGEDTDKVALSQIVEQSPDGRVVNCKVSEWSIWSECRLNGGKCGRGMRTRVRQILRHPENGGRACPKKLMKKQRCSKPCPKSSETEEAKENDISDLDQQFPIELRERIRQRPYECIMSKWSQYSPCNINCGPTAKQQRTRFIIYQPPGVRCPPRLEEKPCNLPLACTNDGRPIFL